MKVSDYIAAFLEAQGVGHVFELVGGMITHLLDSIHRRGRVRLVSMHHEQAAAFAAEGYGRMTGLPGVAMATSGPGATNLLTGIGSCYFASTPAGSRWPPGVPAPRTRGRAGKGFSAPGPRGGSSPGR